MDEFATKSVTTPYLSPSSGPVLPQILKLDSLQFNSQRSTTQLDHLQKLAVSATINSLVSVIQPQQQMPTLGQQTSRKNALNQSLPQSRDQSLIQSQNVLQQQSSLQNHNQQFSQSQSQQKSLLPPQFPDQQLSSQQLQVPENQVQLLQKLYQQQQSLLAHQPALPQDQQEQLANVSQSFSRPISTNQRMELPSQIPRNNRTAGTVGQSEVTDDGPLCSTSPSMIDGRYHQSKSMGGEEITQMNTSGLETVSRKLDFVKDLQKKMGRLEVEGQQEDRQRVGWKLVCDDHENDVLLAGDDPWEEFVSCVKCIKALSLQEVQQLSLDGDFGRNIFLPNQDCSRSAF